MLESMTHLTSQGTATPAAVETTTAARAGPSSLQCGRTYFASWTSTRPTPESVQGVVVAPRLREVVAERHHLDVPPSARRRGLGPRVLYRRRKLQVVDGPVQSAALVQLGVAAALDQPAPVEDQHQVGPAHRRQAVGDDERRSSLHDRCQRLLDAVFGLDVHAGGRVVQHQDRRVQKQCPRDGQPLALPSRELDASFADPTVVLVGQGVDEVVELGRLGGAYDLVHRRVPGAVGDVLLEGRREDEDVLKDYADVPSQRAQIGVADVGTVNGHTSGGDVVEPWDQVRHGALAGARRPEQGDHLPRLDLEAHVRQRLRPGVVADGHAFELDVPPNVRQLAGVPLRGRRRLGVQHLQNSLAGSGGAAHVEYPVDGVAYRPRDQTDVSQERHDFPGSGSAGEHLASSQPQYEADRQGGQERERRPPHGPVPLGAVAQVGNRGRALVELRRFEPLRAEDLDDPHADDVLLQHRRQPARLGLELRVYFAQPLPRQRPCQVQREEGDYNETEAPVRPQDDGRHGDEHRRHREKPQRPECHDALQDRHVGRRARHEVARPLPVVEAEAQAQQRVEDVVPQVVADLLRDRVDQVVLAVAEHPSHRARADDAGRQP